jgi:hypothetical protein
MSDLLQIVVVCVVGFGGLFGVIYLIDAPYRKTSMAQSLPKPLEKARQISSPPGQSKSRIRWFVSDVLLLLIALFALYFTGSPLVTWSLVQSLGITTEASVYERDSDVPTFSEGGPTYWLSYQYQAVGNTYLASQEVSQTTYERLSEGAPILVRYLKFSPSTSLLAGKDTDSSSLWDNIFLFVFVFGPCALVVVMRLLRRHRQSLHQSAGA